MSSSKNRRYIPEIDQLRAMAAILILLYHGLQLFTANAGIDVDATKYWIYSSNPVIAIIEEGHSAVGLFIVLSGLILSIGVIGNRVAYKEFLISRVLRIYPMLLVCLVLAVNVGSSNLNSILTTVLPLNTATVSGGIPGPFTAMAWAVAVEFQCYLIFPFLIMFANERGSRFLIQLIVVAIALRLLCVLATGTSPRDISYWAIIGRLDQFCLGMLAARIYLGWGTERIRPWWFLLAALGSAGMLWLFNWVGGFPSASLWKIIWPDIEGVSWACFILTYLSAGRLLPSLIGRAGAKFGEISYSFYLLHFAVIAAVLKNGMVLHLTGNDHLDALATTILIVLPTTTAISWLTYHTIEQPFLSIRPKYILGSAAPLRSALLQEDLSIPAAGRIDSPDGSQSQGASERSDSIRATSALADN